MYQHLILLMIYDLQQFRSLLQYSNIINLKLLLLVIVKLDHQELKLQILIQVIPRQVLPTQVLLRLAIQLLFIESQYYFLSFQLQLQVLLLSSMHSQRASQLFLLYEHQMMVLFHDNLCGMVICPLEEEWLFLYLYIRMLLPKNVSFKK